MLTPSSVQNFTASTLPLILFFFCISFNMIIILSTDHITFYLTPYKPSLLTFHLFLLFHNETLLLHILFVSRYPIQPLLPSGMRTVFHILPDIVAFLLVRADIIYTSCFPPKKIYISNQIKYQNKYKPPYLSHNNNSNMHNIYFTLLQICCIMLYLVSN